MDNQNEQSEHVEWMDMNPANRCEPVREFETYLKEWIVNQAPAVEALSETYQIFKARLFPKGKPIRSMLFLGPTGCGKTHAVLTASEVIHGDPYSAIKIDCAEFQHSHEISKLVGSPPGYLGHRETPPLFAQDRIERHHRPERDITFIIFDEIEKASDTLWQLLLGILDKATLTLGDNRKVDFTNCVIVMTSNLGAREMSAAAGEGNPLGLAPTPSFDQSQASMSRIGIEAARRHFSPEFMNRLDKVVVFNPLEKEALRKIVDLELLHVQERIIQTGNFFELRCSDAVKDFLLDIGFERRYGARPLKRAIETHLIVPISNLISTKQVRADSILMADMAEDGKTIKFRLGFRVAAARAL
jgi:ATP-dependent Clp protease ATP-binding subunit ClpA